MSDQQTTADQRDDLARIQRRVAEVNGAASSAVETSVDLSDTQHPGPALERTHSDLLTTIRNTRQALVQTERAISASDYVGKAMPREITSDHADRLVETYNGPLRDLALMLLESNRRKWLHEKPETVGAAEVERHGLTANQRDRLNKLQDAWRAYDHDGD